MLSLGIRYLTGCVVASDVADRRRVEWPPHPGRIFMAMAAAHFQTGEEPEERAALEWFEEKLSPPQIHAPGHLQRSAVKHYVPVNDDPGGSKASIQSAPGLGRKRQPREFAKAWIEDEIVYLIWPEIQPGEHFSPLERLCGKVTRIGHSASLVQMWASRQEPKTPPNWLPDETRPATWLRVPGPGLLQYLERQFNREESDAYFDLLAVAAQDADKKQQKATRVALKEKFQNQPPVRLRPELSISHGYAPRAATPSPAAPGTVFDARLVIFALQRQSGPYRHLDLAATLQVTGQFRKALLAQLESGIPKS